MTHDTALEDFKTANSMIKEAYEKEDCHEYVSYPWTYTRLLPNLYCLFKKKRAFTELSGIQTEWKGMLDIR
jgi:hypothetical protein